MRDDFAAFILTHGRPHNVKTVKTMLRAGYTGRWFIVIDNEDKTADEYREVYGDRVLQFDKAAIAAQIDEGDNFNDRRAIIYARNAAFDLAREQGVRYLVQLDDDYRGFEYKTTHEHIYRYSPMRSLDVIWSAMVDYLASARLRSLAMSQGGDHIGGTLNDHNTTVSTKRKSMNTMIVDVENRVPYVGRINEDVNTYVTEGQRGHIHLSLQALAVVQTPTQSNEGGMTDIYLASGTYIKSFYTVMYAPSAAKIKTLGMPGRERLHHSINWNATAVKILHERHRKPRSPS